MDTLEQAHGVPDSERCPIIWRGLSPQDLMRERFSDCRITTRIESKRSLLVNAAYCEKLFVSRPVVREGREVNQLVATLIPIPEKPR